MIDKYKTKKQLISELDDIRQRVSELKTLGADRWTTEEMFNLFLTAVPNSIVLVDQEGKIIFVNSRAESMLGYGQNELIGQQVDILMPLRFRIKHEVPLKVCPCCCT